MQKVSHQKFTLTCVQYYFYNFALLIFFIYLGGIKVSSQVDGTAGDTSDEDGSDISDDQ
jgi:hypothetical protein